MTPLTVGRFLAKNWRDFSSGFFPKEEVLADHGSASGVGPGADRFTDTTDTLSIFSPNLAEFFAEVCRKK